MKLLIFLLFIFVSCIKSNYDFRSDLSYATNIEYNSSYLGKDIISEPKNTWVEVMTFNDKCFFYKTPFGKNLGQIRVTKRKLQRCDFSNEIRFERSEIKTLKIDIVTSGKTNLRLSINDDVEIIPLFNYRVPRKFSAFTNQLRHSYFDNVFINGAAKIEKKSFLSEGTLCHGVNIECKDVVTYQCDLCSDGSYEVVDFNCPQGGSKYCGQDKCGTKNQPACPRGYQVLETKLPSLCFNGSPAGFCSPGLSTFCNDEGILICL